MKILRKEYVSKKNITYNPMGKDFCPYCRTQLSKIRSMEAANSITVKEDTYGNVTGITSQKPIFYCETCNHQFSQDVYKLTDIETGQTFIQVGREMLNSCMLSYNEEKNVLSLSASVVEPMIIITKEKKLSYILNPRIVRISYNLNKNTVFYYNNTYWHKAFGRKSIAGFHLGSSFELNGCGNFPDHMIISFCEELLRRKGIDFKFGEFCNNYRITGWIMDNKFTISIHDLMDLCFKLSVCPNLFVKYDSFTGEKKFIDKNMIDEKEIHTSSQIDVYLPSTTKFRNSLPDKLMDSNEFIKYVCSINNIPCTPALRKQYLQNPITMGLVSWLVKIGITDINNLLKLIPMFDGNKRWYTRTNANEIYSLLRRMCKVYGPNNTTAKIIKDFGMLIDTANLYVSLKRKTKNRMITFGHMTLKEIHDELNKRCQETLIGVTNENISYTSREQKLLGVIDNYSFNLPEDVDRLIDIGDKMHICVGSLYVKPALSKKCTIVYMQSKEDQKYKACIELRRNNIIQAKSYCNMLLNSDEYDAVKKWADSNNLNYMLCSDMAHPAYEDDEEIYEDDFEYDDFY